MISSINLTELIAKVAKNMPTSGVASSGFLQPGMGSDYLLTYGRCHCNRHQRQKKAEPFPTLLLLVLNFIRLSYDNAWMVSRDA
jgi:hypothetical protein